MLVYGKPLYSVPQTWELINRDRAQTQAARGINQLISLENPYILKLIMGQHGSKSSIEARVVFQRFAVDIESSTRMDESSSPNSVRIQKKMESRPKSTSPNFSSRALIPEKCQGRCWSQSRWDLDELEYVMDNPTGGVWVKSKERWTSS